MGWWIFGKKPIAKGAPRPPKIKIAPGGGGQAATEAQRLNAMLRPPTQASGNHIADLLGMSVPVNPKFHGDPDDVLDPDAESDEADYGVGASGASSAYDAESIQGDGSDEEQLDDTSDDDAASYEPAEEDLEGYDLDMPIIGCEVGLSGAGMRK